MSLKVWSITISVGQEEGTEYEIEAGKPGTAVSRACEMYRDEHKGKYMGEMSIGVLRLGKYNKPEPVNYERT